MMKKTSNFLELFTILSCGFILLAPEVYHIYAPEVFWESTSLIPIFVSSYYINFLCTFPVNYEYYHKKTKVVAVVTILASLVNCVLNYILIQVMGMAGAAIATTISHGVQLVVHHGYTSALGKKDYPFPVRIWGGYAAVYFGMVAFVYLTTEIIPLHGAVSMLLRWGVGGVLGIYELLRIRKRKVLI